MLVEMSLGKATKSDPIHAFGIAKKNKHTWWKYVGVLGVLVAFCILSYYVVCCAWTLSFMLKNVSSDCFISFEAVTTEPISLLPLLLVFHLGVTFIVLRGLNSGVEKFNMIVMPLLFIIQGILVVRICRLPGSWEGITYYCVPDFSLLKKESLLVALSQAFFSLCIGEAVLLVYGSYATKKTNLVSVAGYIALLDTMVAVLAGFIIIPAMFITGQDPSQGVGLVYNTLFAIFNNMAYGRFFLGMYLVLLAIAGFTTCMSLLDVTSFAVCRSLGISKTKATLFVSFMALVFSMPSLYGKGGCSWLSNLSFSGKRGFYDIMDFLWGNVAMLLSGFLTTLFVGWFGTHKMVVRELSRHSVFFKKVHRLWSFYIRYIVLPVIICVFVMLYVWDS